MEIQYLGTAAAEGLPALFCGCDICNRARKAGGKEVRTRTQSIVDGRLLIERGSSPPPPRTFWAATRSSGWGWTST